jgi:squalene-associated FAD-dependent desaturase
VSDNTPSAEKPTLAVIGGGLAGLAAAAAAVESGFDVELFEQGRHLGGRAGSFCDPKTGTPIDRCPHVAMGCCTNFLDFCRRTGVAGHFSTSRRLHFLSPGGKRYDFAPAGWLPAPLHLLPALLRLGQVRFGERLSIMRAVWRLAREPAEPSADEETVAAWLRRNGQLQQAVDRFWAPVLVSALSERLDRASLSAAKKVLADGFLGSRRACELIVPKVPLGEILDRDVGAWLEKQGVGVYRRTGVDRIEGDGGRATGLVLRDGSRRAFEAVVLAVPWNRVARLLPEPVQEAVPGLQEVGKLLPAPITAIHLWFDRPITPLPHAVLVERLSQWVFSRGPQPVSTRAGDPPGHHYQVVISASHELIGRPRDELLNQVLADLSAVWPAAGEAELLHSRVITQPTAVFSPAPGIDMLRPAQQTPIEDLALAGDWTATGWPATMESAVRSGYLAVEAVLKSLGNDRRLLVPDLARGWLARRIS